MLDYYKMIFIFYSVWCIYGKFPHPYILATFLIKHAFFKYYTYSFIILPICFTFMALYTLIYNIELACLTFKKKWWRKRRRWWYSKLCKADGEYKNIRKSSLMAYLNILQYFTHKLRNCLFYFNIHNDVLNVPMSSHEGCYVYLFSIFFFKHKINTVHTNFMSCY